MTSEFSDVSKHMDVTPSDFEKNLLLFAKPCVRFLLATSFVSLMQLDVIVFDGLDQVSL